MEYDKKPGSPEEVLAHHGVKGMRWGVRNPNPSSSEIKTARARQDRRQSDFIKNDLAARNATTKSARSKAVRARDASAKDFHTNEDRVTAARLTAGEKFAHAMAFGVFSAVSIPVANARANKVARETDLARQGV